MVLPIMAPAIALAQEGGSNLPMCCRRNGKHHCAMSGAERQKLTAKSSDETRWQAPPERCPYAPVAMTAAMHVNVFTPTVQAAMFAEIVSHPAGVAQTESKWRVACERARGKRGPPVAVA